MAIDAKDERIAELERQLAERTRERDEALAQQTATAEILRVMSQSPADYQPVLDTIAESAARLCASPEAVIHQREDPVLRVVSVCSPDQAIIVGATLALDRRCFSGVAVLDRRTVHIP